MQVYPSFINPSRVSLGPSPYALLVLKMLLRLFPHLHHPHPLPAMYPNTYDAKMCATPKTNPSSDWGPAFTFASG